MDANESFEQYAREFHARFGYLPLGKSDPARPSAERILGDLSEIWQKLRATQPAEPAPSAAPNTGSPKLPVYGSWMEYACELDLSPNEADKVYKWFVGQLRAGA